MIDKTILRRIPRGYHDAIVKLWKADNGYWCIINKEKYRLRGYYTRYVICEEQFRAFLDAFRLIVKVEEKQAE